MKIMEWLLIYFNDSFNYGCRNQISITTANEDPQHLEKGYNYYMQKEYETLISKAILDETVFCTDTK